MTPSYLGPVRLSEAPGFGKPISLYDPSSKGAMAYKWLAEEVVARPVDELPLDAPPAAPKALRRPAGGLDRRRR